jgi:hypothetical protein
LIIGTLQEQGVCFDGLNVKSFDESAGLVTSRDLLFVVGFCICAIQKEAVFTNLVNAFGIFFPNPIVKTRVSIIVDLSVCGQLHVEGVAGDLEFVLGIVQQGFGVFHLILVPDPLHKDSTLSLNVRKTLAGGHYAECQENNREDPETIRFFDHHLF